MLNRTVELGHSYAPDRLVPLDLDRPDGGYSFVDTPEAARLRKIADYFGPPAVWVALLDDVAMQELSDKSAENSSRYGLFIGVAEESLKAGTGAERIYRESQFRPAGLEIIAAIHNMTLPAGYRLSQDGRKLKVGSGKNTLVIPLQGFDGVDDPTYPSCQVLDLAWLQKRLNTAPKAVTVLPAGYENQQQGVGILADLMGIDRDSYQTVIYDPIKI